MKFNRKYNDKEITKIVDSMVILVDTREKKISHLLMYFKHNKIKHIIYQLPFGDYSFMIPKNDKLDIIEDIYFIDEISIERKANAEEISGNFTNGRDRFKREFERSNKAMRLLIEDCSYSNICNGEYDTKLSENSFVASLHSFQEKYDCQFFFTDKQHSGEYIYNTFKYYLKNYLKHKINSLTIIP